MLNVIICDDELKICEDYKKTLSQIFQKMDVPVKLVTYTQSDQLHKDLSTLNIDILLLDIDMPKMTGMEIAREIKGMDQNIILIFVTNQDALVYESFQYQPFQFIRKSVFEQEIEATLRRALEEIIHRKQFYVFQRNAKTIRVLLDDIYYFESDGNYIQLFTKKEVFRIRNTLQSIENELGKSGFVRIHKGFLVNQSSVYKLEKEEVILTNQVSLPIGRGTREVARKRLMEYLMA